MVCPPFSLPSPPLLYCLVLPPLPAAHHLAQGALMVVVMVVDLAMVVAVVMVVDLVVMVVFLTVVVMVVGQVTLGLGNLVESLVVRENQGEWAQPGVVG